MSWPGLLPPRNDPVPIVEEAGWTPGPVWTGAENPFLIGIRTRIAQPLACRSTDYAALAGRVPKAFFLRVKGGRGLKLAPRVRLLQRLIIMRGAGVYLHLSSCACAVVLISTQTQLYLFFAPVLF